MRTLRRRRGATPATLTAALALLVYLSTPALGAPETSPDAVVGGPQLDTTGIVVAPTAPEPPSDLSAASWLVADLDTGQVLAAKNPHGRFAPASTLKTLTALALMPEVTPDELVIPTYEDVAVEGSKVGLVEKVAYPAEELFEAMLMASGNDAANALATAVGGREQAAELMNAAARELQALDTLAVNPSGLDATGQLSSAYDLALIARAAMADDDFARYVATRRSSVGAPAGKPRIEIYNHNKLLANYDGAIGIKNGYTSAARASFVGAAERDGRRLVVTLMRAEPRVWAEAGRLLDWGFSVGVAPASVGELVPPVAETPAQPAEVVSVPAADLAPVASTPAPDDGGPPFTTLTVTLLLTGLAVAFRRRQVVVARRNRMRREARLRARQQSLTRPGAPTRRLPPVQPVSGGARRAAS
jgi:D-alanyl-D-alanine carboxypeptidase (penicillin-binding protein 5/6)